MTSVPRQRRRTKTSLSSRKKRAKVSIKPVHTPLSLTAREIRYQQRLATRMRALTHVLQTSELLECILLHLDVRTLLVSAQRTCTAWRDLITTSPALQIALFFRPDQDGIDTSGGAARQNPLLPHLFPALFPGQHGIASLAVLDPQEATASAPLGYYDGVSGFVGFGGRIAALMRRGASWERMLVQQPPAYHIGQWTTTSSWSIGQSAALMHYKDGLKMGQLYDMATAAMGANTSMRRIVWRGPGTVTEQLQEGGGSMQVAGDSLLADCPPRVPGAREKLDELARTADLILAENLHQSCTVDIDDLLLQSLLNDDALVDIGTIRKRSRKGKLVWRWEGYDMEDDDL